MGGKERIAGDRVLSWSGVGERGASSDDDALEAPSQIPRHLADRLQRTFLKDSG